MDQVDPSAMLDSLHPLEVKVLTAFTKTFGKGPLREEHIAQASGLEPSQLNMAVEWLLAKGLLRVESETLTPIASLTKIGERYFEKYSPIERILSTVRGADHTGKRLTIGELQAKEELGPTEVSSAIGCLKKEGALRVVPGGFVEATGMPSPTAEALRGALKDLHGTPRDLAGFPEATRAIIERYSVKRGNANEPFRIDDQEIAPFNTAAEAFARMKPKGVILSGGPASVTDEGSPRAPQAAATLAREGPPQDVSQLTPELLKDGAWRRVRFRKYTISLRPPRVSMGRRHPYREFLDLVKRKLVSMGFQEMRGPLVETEFWNMDALFMPQFISGPRHVTDVYLLGLAKKMRGRLATFDRTIPLRAVRGAGADSLHIIEP